jgi:hypothetical protein
MMFNIADYAHTLMTDFLVAGGKSNGANSTRPPSWRRC